MKALIFGATGMVGKGVLLECLDHNKVDAVLSIGRSSIGLEHPKLSEIEHKDFSDFALIKDQMAGYDACYFCLGTTAAGKNEEEYTRVSHGFTMSAAKTLFEMNPNMTFIYVSGQGTDSSEKGRMMWARVKGKTENDILKMGFKQAFAFRPGVIVPLRGIKSRTAMYQFMYDYMGWLIWLIKTMSPDAVTDTTKIGLAMINAHLKGSDKSIFDPKDINDLAE